jgi:glycosyltransferase involved in cell wall biosynthesis
MDFLVHTDQPEAFDDEVEALGSRIIRSAETSRRSWGYLAMLRNALTTHGPYDVVHSHVHYLSGLILREAKRLRVPVRIAHSHLDTRPLDSVAGTPRRLYLAVMRRWIRRYATVGLAASGDAAVALFGSRWQEDARWRVLFCGIDLTPFSDVMTRADIRGRLGLGQDAFVVGHVGRFDAQKNQAFLLEVAATLIAADSSVHVLLVGDGGLRPVVERKAIALGIADKVVMTGTRHDVPSLMTTAIDCFVFPSLYEGLGLVLVEAQAAGLPCIIADTVPKEADVIPGLVTRVSLSESTSRWAKAIMAARDRRLPVAEARRLIEASPFSIEASTAELLKIYLP